MSITVLPPQAEALVELSKLDGVVAIEIAEDQHWSLRVATYTRNPDDAPEAPPAAARWWTVSVCGVVREQAPDPEAVAA